MLIWVLHGPNLNLLGTREPGVYGRTSLPQIEETLKTAGVAHDAHVESFQTNHEGILVDRVQMARTNQVDFIIINPAALTHTSVALRDALAAVDIPFIEVHLSNVYRREPFRHHSYLSDIALGVIAGLGPEGYTLALHYAITHLKAAKTARTEDH